MSGFTPENSPHGLTPEAQEQIRQKMRAFLIRPQASHFDALDKVVPKGMFRADAPLRKSANFFSGSPLGFGGGNGQSLFTVTKPYLPEQELDRQLYPTHRHQANEYWRLFYKMDPVIGTVIEMYSKLPWSDFQLTGEGIDGEIKDKYEQAIDECKLRSLFQYFVSEYLVLGEVFPQLNFDNELGIWDHCTLLNPNYVNVVSSPFIKMDPILEFVPDETLKRIVTTNHPAFEPVQEAMPDELKQQIRAGRNIPLNSLNASHIARKLSSYDLRGTSILSRLWRVFMLEDAIWNATLQTARRAAGPIKVVKLGDPATGTIPGADEEGRIIKLLAQAEADPQCFVFGTPVVLADNSTKSVEELTFEDRLLDKDGNEVHIAALRTEYTTETVRIHVQGGKEAVFECTPHHNWPIFGRPRECMCGCGEPIATGNFANGHACRMKDRRYWRPVNAPVKIDDVKLRFVCGFDPHQKLAASSLRRGDYLKIPRRFQEATCDVSQDKARLLGYYLAEGFHREVYRRKDGSVRHGVQFTFGAHEEHTWAADTNDIIAALHSGEVESSSKVVGSVCMVYAQRNSTSDLAEWLRANGGQYAKTKRLSKEVMSWPLDLKFQMLVGFLRGDGNLGSRDRTLQTAEFNTTSYTLALQVQKIIAQLGAYAPVYKKKNDQGFSAADSVIYSLHVNGDLADRLLLEAYGHQNKARTVRASSWWVDDDYVYVKITKVEHVKHAIAIPVINMSVHGDHSYQARNFGTYNSWIAVNYQTSFEMAGAPERIMSINQHYDLIERLKLSALGVSKSFISGETSHSSSAAGLTVFMQNLKALRDFFVNEWLIPKFFLPMAKINEWMTKESKVKDNQDKRTRRQGSVDTSKYLVPKIEWSKSLDPNIEIDRMEAFKSIKNDLGLPISDQKIYACAGLEIEEELKQIVAERKLKKDIAGQDPELMAAVGLMQAGDGEGGPGGSLGGGAPMVSPGIPGEAFGMPGGGGDMGGDLGGGDLGGAPGDVSGPPGGALEPGPAPGPVPSPEGAELHADTGSKPTAPQPKKDKSKVEKGLEYWAKSTLDPIMSAFSSFDSEDLYDSDPWEEALKSKRIRSALKAQDSTALWEAVEEWLIDENYPLASIDELKDALAARGKVASLRDPDAERLARQLGVDTANFSLLGLR